jgi:hypothetical protein
MKVAVGRCPQSGEALASQSTISRLENAPRKIEAARLCAALIDQFGTTVKPGRLEILDIDDTFCAAHGSQQLAFWNAHHNERGFASMHIYHVASGTPVVAILYCPVATSRISNSAEPVDYATIGGRHYRPSEVTRQTVLPTSSAINNAPVLSTATPTGRPRASPFAFRNPLTTSSRLAVRMAAAEGHEHDFVAVELLAVPAPVFAYERSTPIFLRQAVGHVEGEPQRRHVGAQRVDWSFGRRGEFWDHSATAIRVSGRTVVRVTAASGTSSVRRHCFVGDVDWRKNVGGYYAHHSVVAWSAARRGGLADADPCHLNRRISFGVSVFRQPRRIVGGIRRRTHPGRGQLLLWACSFDE